MVDAFVGSEQSMVINVMTAPNVDSGTWVIHAERDLCLSQAGVNIGLRAKGIRKETHEVEIIKSTTQVRDRFRRKGKGETVPELPNFLFYCVYVPRRSGSVPLLNVVSNIYMSLAQVRQEYHGGACPSTERFRGFCPRKWEGG